MILLFKYYLFIVSLIYLSFLLHIVMADAGSHPDKGECLHWRPITLLGF